MININLENLKDMAFEDDCDDDFSSMSPEDEAEELLSYYEQKYGFSKIAG